MRLSIALLTVVASVATAQETPQQGAVDGSVLIRNVRVTPGALEITGTLDAGLPYGWSGVMFAAGQTAMTPVNLSSKKELRFSAKAEDRRLYAIMMFTRSKGQMPVIQRFTASGDWKEVVMPFSSFAGADGHDLMGRTA